MRILAILFLLVFSFSNLQAIAFDEEIPEIITWDFTIDMFNEDYVSEEITVDAWDLTIDSNTDISENIVVDNWKLTLISNNTLSSITLKWAKELSVWPNSSITKLSWTSKKITIDANSDIEKLNISTDKLTIDANSDILSWVIYVYGDFKWSANADFSWKLTVHDNTFIDSNGDFKARFCSLWKTSIWANTDIITYNFSWLFWNIDPILAYNIDDNSTSFDTVKDIAVNFDEKFNKSMEDVAYYNSKIYTARLNLKKYNKNSSEYDSTLSEIDSYKLQKESVKDSCLWNIEDTFESIEKYIDNHEEATNLFKKVEKMYISAVKYENPSFVFQICNNSEILWDANSVFVKNWIINYNGKTIARELVLPTMYQIPVQKKLEAFSEDQLAILNKKLNDIIKQFIIRPWNEKNVNMLLDLNDMIKNSILY